MIPDERNIAAARDGPQWRTWYSWGAPLAIALAVVGYQVWYQTALNPARAIRLFWLESLTFGLLGPLVAWVLLSQLLKQVTANRTTVRQMDLLRTHETYLASIIGSSADAIIGLDLDDRIITWNRGAEEMFGYRADEIVGRTPQALLAPGETGDAQWAAIRSAVQSDGAARNRELMAQTRSGSPVPVDVTHTLVRDGSGRLLGSAAILRDASERVRHAEEERRHSQELSALYAVSTALNRSTLVEDALAEALASLLRALEFDSGRIYLLDAETQRMALVAARGDAAPLDSAETAVQPGQCLCGMAILTGEPWDTQDAAHDPRVVREDCRRFDGLACAAVPLVAKDRVVGVLHVAKSVDGPLNENDLALLRSVGAQIGTYIDNLRLAEEVRRAEALSVLVQEMHHRIKNNLQTVADLLSLEMSTSPSSEARKSLRDSISRIKSIAAVHELLSTEQLRLTDITELARKVCDVSLRHLLRPHQDVIAEVRGPSIFLPSKQATALALVINELVSNALEHAFTDGCPGRLIITMNSDGARVSVAIRDDGKGLNPGFSLELQCGLGLQIARTLVEKDLAGAMEMSTHPDGGTIVTLTFYR